MRIRRLTVAVLAAVLAPACGGGDGPLPAATVVERFVRAVAAGDVEAAMALQCSAVRLPQESRALWRSQLRRFQDAVGKVTGASAERIGRTGMRPAADLPGVVEVSYRVAIDGEERQPLLAATVLEHGERRVCGRGTPSAKELFAVFSALPPPGPDTEAVPRVLLPAAPPAGHHQIEDEAAEPRDPRPGELDGWTRAWQRGDYGGARATAVRFDTVEHARQAVAHYLSTKSGDSVEAIVLPGLPYARGTRLLGFAWLGIQPPDLGPYVDFVYAVFGRTMVIVAASDLPVGSDHAVVGDLLGAIAASVGPSP